jgi:gamma-glutamyltranspeptidase/glutathione hydrolase
VSAAYARARAASIDLGKVSRRPRPGTPPSQTASRDRDEHDLGEMTSQIAVVDRAGNAVAITTTINLDFGARIMVGGFVLNNAMNVFSDPVDADGTTSNRMAPGKRPSTSMAPVIAFDAEGRPVVVGGAAGGRMIPDYVASALVEMLGNGRTPAEALGKGHISAAIPGRVRLEARTAAARLATALKAKGHVVEEGILLSGLAFLKRVEPGWIGAADPRRDGAAMGQ